MGDKQDKYRLDRTAFRAISVEEADNHYGYWKNKSVYERLDGAFYLINQVYKITSSTHLDRTIFSKRKHS